MTDSWASWVVPVLFGPLICVVIGGFALFIIATIQYLRLRAYTIRKHPRTWREFVDSGRIISWLPSTNIRDYNILRRAAQDDYHLSEMVRNLDKTCSRYLRVFVLGVVIFSIGLVVVIYLAIIQRGA
jgi:hypothetical protein